MTFSNVNVFRSAALNLKSSEPGATADKIIRGGAFSPNTQEAIAIMRSDVDNQWENAYIIKYQALMQNRLNRLKQDLTNSYKSLLEVSSVQQVRENDITSANTALTDVYGKILPNATEAFKSLTYYNNEEEFSLADGGGYAHDPDNLSAEDGVPSYLLNTTLKQYGPGADADKQNGEDGVIEMRKLYVTGPALQVTNSMKIAFRTEEVPTEYTKVELGPLPLPIPLGDKPYVAGQKVAEYSAEVKAGGFFTTLNYLYNFAPRELKYTYPTAYSTNTEEAGSRQVTYSDGAKTQAVLFNNQVTDSRDVYSVNPQSGGKVGGLTEDAGVPSYTNNDGDKPPIGSRIKWNNSNASDGYTTERSPMFTQRNVTGGAINDAQDNRAITRRESDNDSKFRLDAFNSFGDIVKGDASNPWIYDPTTGKKVTYYGTEENIGGSGSMADRIKWEYNHDGKATMDLNQDGSANDDHVAKAAFINHYTVQTQTVELNSSAKSYGTIKAVDYDGIKTTGVDQERKQLVLRSTGIDGSAEHVFNDADKDKVVDENKDEKLILAGSGKIAKNFDGSYVASLYNLSSFNGQNIATESANINITSRNDKDKVVIAEYEGFKRAQTMNKGMSDDIFSSINFDPSAPRSFEDAQILARKLETEINASNMVDTDWHYSEYSTAANTGVMFKHIAEVPFQGPNGADSIKVNYRPDMIEGGVGGNFTDITVGFRKTFSLEPRDFQKAVYSGSTNSDIYINTPTYINRDVFVSTVVTNSTDPSDLIVNGKIVPPTVTGTGNPRTITYNIGPYLKAGDNVIASQVSFDIADGPTTKDSFELLSSTNASYTNIPSVDSWIKSKLSTIQADNGDNQLDKLTQSNLSKQLSSWQSKIMVEKITPAFFNINFPYSQTNPLAIEPGSPPGFVSQKAYDEYINALNTLGSVETSTRVKENNSFARMLTDALNKPEYQDIYNLGLLNTDLGKTMTIKAQVSAPTGGSVSATIDIQYDPINNKFILVQSKFDAFGGT